MLVPLVTRDIKAGGGVRNLSNPSKSVRKLSGSVNIYLTSLNSGLYFTASFILNIDIKYGN